MMSASEEAHPALRDCRVNSLKYKLPSLSGDNTLLVTRVRINSCL